MSTSTLLATAAGNSLVRTGDGTSVQAASGLVDATGANALFLTSGGKFVTEANASTIDTIETLTDGATVTWAWDKAVNYAVVTLGGSRTLSITGMQIGDKGVLKVIQDGTGSRVITWPTTTLKPATPLTTTASAIDVVVLEYVASGVFVMTVDTKNVS